MIHYRVEAQDATGRKITVDVHAKTDEQACDAALRTLNSWRALRALPARALDRSPLVDVPPRPTTAADFAALPVLDMEEFRHETETKAPEKSDHAGVAEGDRAAVASSPRGPRVIRTTTIVEEIATVRGPLGPLGRALAEAARRSR